MSILDNDDNVARREVEVLASPAQVILDIRKDVQKFKDGGPRKELVEALRDQFVATRHQAAVKAEATRMLALDILLEKLHEIKSVSELMRAISALAKISENELAAVFGTIPGSGPLLNRRRRVAIRKGFRKKWAVAGTRTATSSRVANADSAVRVCNRAISRPSNAGIVCLDTGEPARILFGRFA